MSPKFMYCFALFIVAFNWFGAGVGIYYDDKEMVKNQHIVGLLWLIVANQYYVLSRKDNG